jgi:hypothetical protein
MTFLDAALDKCGASHFLRALHIPRTIGGVRGSSILATPTSTPRGIEQSFAEFPERAHSSNTIMLSNAKITNMFDVDGDGKIDEEELNLRRDMMVMRQSDVKFKALRRMAWIALISMVATVLSTRSYIPPYILPCIPPSYILTTILTTIYLPYPLYYTNYYLLTTIPPLLL